MCASQPTTKPRSEQRHPLLFRSSCYLQQCEKILSCSVTSCQLGTCFFRLVTSCSCAELRSCSCSALRRWGGATMRLTRRGVTGNGFSAVVPVPLLMLAGDFKKTESDWGWDEFFFHMCTGESYNHSYLYFWRCFNDTSPMDHDVL